MASSAIITKISSGVPSDEAQESLEESTGNSGTTMASSFRKMRLQGLPSPTRDDKKELTPMSPGGSVLAKVQMFEQSAGKSPSYRASISANKDFANRGKFSSSRAGKSIQGESSPASRNGDSAAEIDLTAVAVKRKLSGFQHIVTNPSPEELEPNNTPSGTRTVDNIMTRMEEKKNERGREMRDRTFDIIGKTAEHKTERMEEKKNERGREKRDRTFDIIAKTAEHKTERMEKKKNERGREKRDRTFDMIGKTVEHKTERMEEKKNERGREKRDRTFDMIGKTVEHETETAVVQSKTTTSTGKKMVESTMPDYVEKAADKAIAESSALSERRRKMALAKKHAANARLSNSPVNYNELGQTPHLSNTSTESIDPLDREAQRKRGKDVLQLTTSPGRLRKFKMAEASIKKNIQRDKETFAGSSRADSNSSLSDSSRTSVNSTDLSEPGALSPKFPKLDDSGVLPTIQSHESRQSDYVVSPTSLPGKRDRSHRSMYNDYDKSPSPPSQDENPPPKRIDGQSSKEQSSKEKKRNRSFHHIDSAEQMYNDAPPEETFFTPNWDQSKPGGEQSHQGHYFAPIVVDGTPNLSFDDHGDDETQFNSVVSNSMQDHHDRKKSKDRQANSNSLLHSPGASTKESDGGSYFFTGGSRKSEDSSYRKKMPLSQHLDTGHHSISENDPHRDDDADSFTDSVTNGSWTGRMRARKAMQQPTEPEKIDQRIDPRLGGMSSPRTPGHSYDDGMSVTDRVFSTVQRQKKAAVSDAQEGLNTFASEDPNTTAVGLGIAGALCGAIMFGPFGIILGAASAGAGYKFSQMPEDEKTEVKSKASTAMHKFHESALSANEKLCGSGQKGTEINENCLPISNVPPFRPSSPAVNEQVTKSPTRERSLKVSNLNPNPQQHHLNPADQAVHASRLRQIRRISPACQRMGRITPVGQIHSLDPALHPRAWLDVMSCNWTSREEKNEAMEEILLLAKDKVSLEQLHSLRVHVPYFL